MSVTSNFSDSSTVKISKIETIVVNAEMRNWIFVKVYTDQDGLYGWGEASLNWKTASVVSAVKDFARMIIGKDPRDIELCLEILKKQSYYRLGIIGITAISGIEQALWDICGKYYSVPVWRLLGGKVREKLRVYTHLGLGDMRSVYETFETARLVEKAQEVVEKGYDALKVVFIPYSGYLSGISERKQVGRLMGALREAVGDNVDIMIDFHGRPESTACALDFIKELLPYNPMFCEEPVQPGDTESLRFVTERAGCAIAGGERLIGLAEFIPVFAQRALHIAQPDLSHTGGLLEGKRIAALADANMIGIAPHNPNGPIAGAVALHYDISTPNFVIQEEMSRAVPWYEDIVTKSPIKRNGSYWEIPMTVGLGVEVDEKEAARHPYKDDVLHSASALLSDGTITNW
ncbi:MAG: enolase C-terminal domain-like protein [Synergistaceae bacterium]|nr:enolase C-terminal domain-like protein [Synergistaceae bacterium]